MKKKLYFDILIFLLIFFILGFFAIKLFLYLDDYNFVFPAIYGNYLTHFQNYIHDFGISRPLALVYYYFIYSIYIHISWLAHLIPLLLVLFSTFLLSKTLKLQGLTSTQSFASGLLFISLPFIAESYSWLSANISIIVITILFIQIYLIESNFFNKNISKIALLLQLTSIFIYETTIFMSIPIAYLLYINKKMTKKSKLFLFLIIPLCTYYLTKLILKPQFDVRSKLISISEVFSNWNSSLIQLKILFSFNYLSNFWGKEIADGFNLLTNKPLILFSISCLVLLILVRLFMQSNTKVIQNNINSRIYFWIITFIFCLAPLTWQKGYLPFRTLVLPVITIFITLLFSINRIIKHKINNFLIFLFKLLFTCFVFLFLTIQVSILNQYFNQNSIDKKITVEINEKLENLGFEHPYRSNLYLKGMYKNNCNRLLYGDYLFTTYNYYWSAEALLDLNSGSFAKVGIEYPNDNNFSASLTKNEFMKLRPLTIMIFTDNESCLKGECLKIESVYHKPY